MKEKILTHLPAECPWRDTLHWFNSTDSTNTQAKVMAQNGAPHGTVVIAGHQTGGRGRMGRSFSSPDGKGIYLSVILRPGCHAEDLMHLTCAAAVAMCDAVEETTGYRPGIKWINDLVGNGKKLGGILTELSVESKSGLVQYAVIGIGINCSQSEDDFPEEIRHIAVSARTLTGKAVEQSRLSAAMISALWTMDAALMTHKTEIMNAYRKNCITLGQQVVVLRSDEKRYGTATDIDADGGLLVAYDDGTTETVSSGEVSVRGMYGYI